MGIHSCCDRWLLLEVSDLRFHFQFQMIHFPIRTQYHINVLPQELFVQATIVGKSKHFQSDCIDFENNSTPLASVKMIASMLIFQIMAQSTLESGNADDDDNKVDGCSLTIGLRGNFAFVNIS
jgi:hypothetical protein